MRYCRSVARFEVRPGGPGRARPTRSCGLVNDLDDIRKRAKQLVRDHRAGLMTVAERIRRGLPRFAGMSDREILAARFSLHDAQQLVASELGFSGWEDLVAAPSTPPPSMPPVLGVWRAFTQVFVRDISCAIDWYQAVLDFDVDYLYGSPPFYAQLSCAGVALNLRVTGSAPWPHPPPEPDLLAVRLEVDDVKALYRDVRHRGAELHQTLRREPWGQQTFIVRDPDGNLISFGSHMYDRHLGKDRDDLHH